MLFFCKKVSPTHPHLIFNRTGVSKVSEHKHLSLILESDLSIDKHLDSKMIKAKKNVRILKHLSRHSIKCIKLSFVLALIIVTSFITCYQYKTSHPLVSRSTALWKMLRKFNIKQLWLLQGHGMVPIVQRFMKNLGIVTQS